MEKLVNGRQFSMGLTFLHILRARPCLPFLPNYLVKNVYVVNSPEKQNECLSPEQRGGYPQHFSLSHPSSNPPENVSSALKTYPESNAFSIFLWLIPGSSGVLKGAI